MEEGKRNSFKQHEFILFASKVERLLLEYEDLVQHKSKILYEEGYLEEIYSPLNVFLLGKLFNGKKKGIKQRNPFF